MLLSLHSKTSVEDRSYNMITLKKITFALEKHIFFSSSLKNDASQIQWRSQGLSGWASCPPRGPIWGEEESEKKLRKIKNNWSKFEERMRKLDRVPTRDCEAGYGPAQIGNPGVELTTLQASFKFLMGILHPNLKLLLFCVLSQNYQHFFEKWCMPFRANCPRNSNMTLKL